MRVGVLAVGDLDEQAVALHRKRDERERPARHLARPRSDEVEDLLGDAGMTEPHEHSSQEPDWDARYNESERIWSGEPNGALVAEMANVLPGRALDVGCGEGADAVWLAQHGWDVTALDVAKPALERGERAADAA